MPITVRPYSAWLKVMVWPDTEPAGTSGTPLDDTPIDSKAAASEAWPAFTRLPSLKPAQLMTVVMLVRSLTMLQAGGSAGGPPAKGEAPSMVARTACMVFRTNAFMFHLPCFGCAVISC
jgi:hypothetical protein